jgi:hypothetical protein
MRTKGRQLKTVKSSTKVEASVTTWDLAIADAQERISQLGRSIEIFKHNIKAGVPFPSAGNPATRNQKATE